MNEQIQPRISYINCEELRQFLHGNNVSIIDVQPDIHDYIKEHIPGAVYVNEQHFRMFRNHLPTEYAPEESLEILFQYAGISSSRPVVIYGGNGRFSGTGDGLEQTMAAYTLSRFGHNTIYILEGGFETWIASGYELEKAYPFVQPSDFKVVVNNSLYVNYAQFCEIKNTPSALVIDVRPHSVYEGKSIWSKPGHIPGAVNLPWRLLMEHDNPRKPRSISYLKEIAATHSALPERDLILYCGTGREATASFIVFKHILNYPSVRIYEGSFTEWCTVTDQITMTGVE